jgi:uncharacterized protein (TIGR03032 family)
MSTEQTPQATPDEPWVNITASGAFAGFLAQHRVSLGLTTYQAGKLFLIGRNGPNLAVFERTFNRSMGLCFHQGTLWMSSLYQLWRFENALRAGNQWQGCDALYVPRVGYTTGDLDTHDVAVDAEGRPVFIVTRFCCLATLSERDSFKPLWKPPFISRLTAEDRCHLNGLALDEERKPKFVTACSTTDTKEGWREQRKDGGVIIDVPSGEIVARGFSMPHSPRLHQGKLYVHNSGEGWFGTVSPASGEFQPLTFCPGYLRGMTFVGDYAIVGLSKPRQATFSGLRLDENLAQRQVEAECGLRVIHLPTGEVRHWLRIEGSVTELYDVVAIPGVVRPAALGFKSDEIRSQLSIEI